MLFGHMHTTELLQKKTSEFIPPKLWAQNLPDLNAVDNSMWEISQEKVTKKEHSSGAIKDATDEWLLQ